MRPIAAVTLIILGSSFAITVSLCAVVIIVLVLENPRLQHEFDAVLRFLLVFTGMTTISALSFYTIAKNLSGWLAAQTAMWLTLLGIVWYYWP